MCDWFMTIRIYEKNIDVFYTDYGISIHLQLYNCFVSVTY